MAIRPLSPDKIPPPFVKRKAGTVDLEWNPDNYELRCVGVFYRGRYQYFLSVNDFLAWLLTPENDGIQLWAHYGGRADFAFIIPALVAAKIPMDGLVNGSSVFAITITVGRRKYYLRDSYFLTMGTLQEAGMTFAGRGKMECSFTAPLRELLEYNEGDCRLLYDVLVSLDELWGELGTHIGITNASTAFSLFRARYLKEEIPTYNATNDTFRKRALFCSLVAPYCRSVERALERTGATHAVGYDQNSAHPCSYTGPMPGAELKGGTSRPTGDVVWFVDAEITVPESVNIPPIPIRTDTGRICHPVGTWRALLFKEQVDLLESNGGRIEKAHWYYSFRVNRDLENFGRDLFERKLKSVDANGNNTPLTAVTKYALNAGGFGKFSERPDRMQLVVGQIPERLLYSKDGEPLASAEKIRFITPNICMVPSFRPAPHEHVPMSVVTAGRSMVRLESDMQAFEKNGSIVLYADTDGFKATAPPNGYKPVIGNGLGEYKLEYPRIVAGHFAGPKLYAIKDVELMRTIVRAKSFPTAKYGEIQPNGKRRGLLMASDEHRPISALMTYEKIGALCGADWPYDGEEEPTERTVQVEFERMRRIPETLNAHSRGGTIKPGSITIVKRPRAPRPSRKFDDNGFSVPWHIKEIT